MPPKHHTFIQTALWKKIPVGLRLANWLPHNVPCPIDGQVEDVEHALCGCRFLTPAFHIAQQCMGPAILDDLTESDPQVILWEQLALSLQTPLGLVLWTAIMANWNLQNAVKFRDPPPPPHMEYISTPMDEHCGAMV